MPAFKNLLEYHSELFFVYRHMTVRSVVATALVRTITRLAMAKKLVSEQRASKVALERLVAEESMASR